MSISIISFIITITVTVTIITTNIMTITIIITMVLVRQVLAEAAGPQDTAGPGRLRYDIRYHSVTVYV